MNRVRHRRSGLSCIYRLPCSGALLPAVALAAVGALAVPVFGQCSPLMLPTITGSGGDYSFDLFDPALHGPLSGVNVETGSSMSPSFDGVHMAMGPNCPDCPCFGSYRAIGCGYQSMTWPGIHEAKTNYVTCAMFSANTGSVLIGQSMGSMVLPNAGGNVTSSSWPSYIGQAPAKVHVMSHLEDQYFIMCSSTACPTLLPPGFPPPCSGLSTPCCWGSPAYHPGWSLSVTITYTFQDHPAISGHPASQTTCPRGVATFTTTAAGPGTLGYQWQWRPTGASAWTDITAGPNTDPVTAQPAFVGSGLGTPTLTLTNTPGPTPAMSDRAREVRVIVSNSCGLTPSNLAAWTVCAADYNCTGDLAVSDIFDFIAGWFTGDPNADFNGGGADVTDIFDFLGSWFGGCA